MPEVTLKFSRPLRELTPLDPVGKTAATAATSTAAAESEVLAKDLALVLKGLKKTASDLRVRYEQMLRDLEKGAIELGMAAARHFLLTQVDSGAFPMEAIVRKALETLPARQPITLNVNPRDLAVLKNRLGNESLSPEPDIEFIADPRLARGTCTIQAGELTARFDLDQQLAELRARLLESQPASDELPETE